MHNAANGQRPGTKGTLTRRPMTVAPFGDSATIRNVGLRSRLRSALAWRLRHCRTAIRLKLLSRTLHTSRTVLRPWRDEDLAPFAAINADQQVMKFFPRTLTCAESDALLRSF